MVASSEIIWSKPNPLPESITDRPARSHETVYLLTKARRYYFNMEAVKEPLRSSPSDLRKMVESKERIGGLVKASENGELAGRNLRTVWEIGTTPYPGGHFAVMPWPLAQRCILAGCPEGGMVLDPFAGSGTTLYVARKLGRNSIGFEINEEYGRLIDERLQQGVLL